MTLAHLTASERISWAICPGVVGGHRRVVYQDKRAGAEQGRVMAAKSRRGL